MKVTLRLLLGLAVLVALLGGTAFAFASVSIGGTPSRAMQITFPSADGLVAGSDVLEAGAKVGYIQRIEPARSNTALVTVEIDGAHWPLHQGLSADIRPKSLLGEKYVDLHDGPSSAAVYDTNQVLHARTNADPVELDQFINSLGPTTRTAVRVLLDDFGAGLAGRGQDLNAAIAAGKADLANFAVTGRTLNNRNADLDKILVELDGVLSRITTNDQLTQMSQLITNGQNVLNDIEAVKASFSRQFTDANSALADLNTAFDGAVPSLKASIDIAPTLASNLQAETAMLQSLGAGITANCPGPKGSAGYGNPCALQVLEEGLVRGPTVSGGALQLGAPNTLDSLGNPIFRICLTNVPPQPTTPGSGSCENSSSPRTSPAAYWGGVGGAALFAGFLGS
ncbi:MAG: MCE family protein [Chloroflexi bacterium]|nr:MAG: MCE family protein [Chloroflexota bacterium]TMF15944.1 MAG: MCE family protein [Chloroflexota bacterium]